MGFEPTRKLAPPSDFQDLSCNLADLHRCGSQRQSGRVFGTTCRASHHWARPFRPAEADGYSTPPRRTSADTTTMPDRRLFATRRRCCSRRLYAPIIYSGAEACRSFLLEALPTDRQTPANRHARCPAKPEHGTPTGSLICVSNGVSMAVADAGRRAVRSELKPHA